MYTSSRLNLKCNFVMSCKLAISYSNSYSHNRYDINKTIFKKECRESLKKTSYPLLN